MLIFKRYWFILLFLTFYCSTLVFAKGAGFAKPKYSLIDAAKIAEDYFYNKFTNDNSFAKGQNFKDFILCSAKYLKSYEEETFPEAAWVFTFVSTLYCDHSFIFKVTNDGKISLLNASK